MKKKAFLAAILCCSFLLRLFSQEDVPEDFDVLFNTAEDVDTPVIKEEEAPKNTVTLSGDGFSVPLRLSGHLESEVALGYENDSGKSGISSGVKFKNDITASTRLDQTFAFKATMRTKFPETKQDKQWQIGLHEMYFDYVPFSHLYITAGKKETYWGNIRLFSNSDLFEDDDDALYTNILADSNDGTSMLLRIPFGVINLSGFALYKGNGDDPKYEDVSYAGCFELVIGQTSINLMGRQYPSENSAIVAKGLDTHHNPLVGIELKRTIFGADIYVQELGSIEDSSKVKEYNEEGFSKLVFTGGSYGFWETQGPSFGYNVEYQDVYKPLAEKHSRKIAFYGGVYKLGKRRNIGVGVNWKHYFKEGNDEGEVEPGVVLSGIFPHAKWKNGVKIEYGDEFESVKYTIGTSILINLDY